ncbi:Abi family protein [Gardnerella vaginalis]|uniref:Abi-like protein n=4 Tax=Bifidobacteriaceae TaxID=31953 RepID=T2PMT4_9BIFI|nr:MULTISPECIES: Abi family protein [Gardnerella]EPI53660.1 Abi-like protein [Gardnerella pickettii JCP8017A]EPI54574.1 Abi-like protein [Gardnerella pickettii JCP7659]EPI62214.1 Abi-like protein [Gardnerella pickettii JCP8017B]MDK6472456.1 Abi family protein [Bifidobacterium sp. UMB9259]MDK7188521.1 Abi family protein [Bifidobacterium sp. UMB1230]MDK7785768.1 Abi family protein [Bifidobacterium sp. UMB6791B]MDK8248393.1 Abi family protein [Bifidobacterium sp. UMB6794B]MDK8636094.1 Abi fami
MAGDLVGMMVIYKPFTTIKQQIKLLKSRGVVFSDELKAMEILEREGYYSVVNGYKNPFLESKNSNKYVQGTKFEHIYYLFKFDRELRGIIFAATTRTEALLRSSCSYCFSQIHDNEVNAYLNEANYEDPKESRGLVRAFNRIIENNTSNNKKLNLGKEYIRHCINNHDGQVPLWVLSNDLTFGQIFWFYKVQTRCTRGLVAREYTELYNSSHCSQKDITSIKIDSTYRRIKEFRNICAHDERLYCARPHSFNATVFQLIKDFDLFLDTNYYLEFLEKIEKLLSALCVEVPSCSKNVIECIGMSSINEFYDWKNKIKENITLNSNLSVPNEATLKAMNHANQIIDGKISEDGIVFSNANEAKAFLDNMS